MAATAGGGGGAAGRDSSDEDMQPLDLEKFAVGSLPTIFYIPDFVTPSQEQFLLHQVDGAPMSKWKVLKNRRLQNWGMSM
ncbi:hypothetical protein O6H91_17G049400 [Diphasiastrum complanatum]|uniref:Uncharacterized protein n=1 Tax=Diphasiastrum complanatum TaxID=34168 RepID=A0ACC2B7J6_DIPCM|nr:hypothetical protein O6H91_17G049400 [Diphasiastrum complanatum]